MKSFHLVANISKMMTIAGVIDSIDVFCNGTLIALTLVVVNN